VPQHEPEDDSSPEEEPSSSGEGGDASPEMSGDGQSNTPELDVAVYRHGPDVEMGTLMVYAVRGALLSSEPKVLQLTSQLRKIWDTLGKGSKKAIIRSMIRSLQENSPHPHLEEWKSLFFQLSGATEIAGAIMAGNLGEEPTPAEKEDPSTGQEAVEE
jgi:hypothetical protein